LSISPADFIILNPTALVNPFFSKGANLSNSSACNCALAAQLAANEPE
jgi:hypothetical protein